MIKMAFGADSSGSLVHVSQADRGATDLVCLWCGDWLVARKGDVYQHHFSHRSDNHLRQADSCTYTPLGELELVTEALLDYTVESGGKLQVAEGRAPLAQIYEQVAPNLQLSPGQRQFARDQLAKLSKKEVVFQPAQDLVFDEVQAIRGDDNRLQGFLLMQDCEPVGQLILECMEPDVTPQVDGGPVLLINLGWDQLESIPAMLEAQQRGDLKVRWADAGSLRNLPPELQISQGDAEQYLQNRKDFVRDRAAAILQRGTPVANQFGGMNPVAPDNLVDYEEWLEERLQQCENLERLVPHPLNWYESEIRPGYREKLELNFRSVMRGPVPDGYKVFAASLMLESRENDQQLSWIELARMTGLQTGKSCK